MYLMAFNFLNNYYSVKLLLVLHFINYMYVFFFFFLYACDLFICSKTCKPYRKNSHTSQNDLISVILLKGETLLTSTLDLDFQNSISKPYYTILNKTNFHKVFLIIFVVLSYKIKSPMRPVENRLLSNKKTN